MINLFNSITKIAKGNLSNRPNHQVTVGLNWIWMSFSKLPNFLDVLCSIIVTSHQFPLFQNEKDYETGIVPFVVMLYLFTVCNRCVVCIGVPSHPPLKSPTPRLPFLGNPVCILVFREPFP